MNTSSSARNVEAVPFLFDQERRVDLAGGVIHRDDEIEGRRSVDPGKRAAILMQHHADAGLARPLAAVCAPPSGTLDRARRLQPKLGPGVAPLKPILPPQMFVEVLHVPVLVARPVLADHPAHRVDRDAPRRRLAEPPIHKAGLPFLLVTPSIPAELTLRAPQKLSRLLGRKLPALPAAQYAPKLLHPAVLQPRRPVHRSPADSWGNETRTTRVLPNPDNSCAYDN